MTAAEPVLIIGAGVAGLLVAAQLRQAGVDAEILERGDAIGAAWRARYDQLTLNTCRWHSRLPDFPFPAGTPAFPGRDDFIRYLDGYAARHQVKVRYGVRASRIDPCPGGWRVSTSAGERAARQVVVATGYLNEPRLPDWPGLASFPGRVLHSANYRSAAGLRGADVLVVGAGCSAMDIAYGLVTGGAARVRLAVRSAPHLWLRAPLGVPGDLVRVALFRVPARVGDLAEAALRAVSVGSLSRHGITRPREGFFGHVARVGLGPTPTVVDRPVLRAIRARKIEVVPAVSDVGADGALLADGSRARPQVIIAATGFTAALEPLVGHLGILDERGLPPLWGKPAPPGLHFAGFGLNIAALRHSAVEVAGDVIRDLAGDALLPGGQATAVS